MNTETMKLMSDAMKGMTEFVNRQTAMNETLTKTIVELQNQVKELTETDEAFTSYQEKLAVGFAHKSKEHLQAEKSKFDSAVAEAVEKRVTKMKEAKASDESSEGEADKKENLEEALEEAEQVTPEISNTNEASSGETETLRTKFQSAFSKENIKVTY